MSPNNTTVIMENHHHFPRIQTLIQPIIHTLFNNSIINKMFFSHSEGQIVLQSTQNAKHFNVSLFYRDKIILLRLLAPIIPHSPIRIVPTSSIPNLPHDQKVQMGSARRNFSACSLEVLEAVAELTKQRSWLRGG